MTVHSLLQLLDGLLGRALEEQAGRAPQSAADASWMGP